MKLIKRLQSKPNSVKARYAFFTALFCTVVIAFVWSTTLPARFSHIGGTQPAEETRDESTESFTDIFNEAKVQVGNVVNWDEKAQEEVTTTNLDALSESHSQPATTTGVATPTLEEKSSTTTEALVESATPRTVLIEVRQTGPEEGDEIPNESAQTDTNTQTP